MTPQRVLMVFTIMNRGGAETMVMNYYRHMDRSRLQFDFLVHRETPGIYEEEIRRLGGRIYRLPPITLRGLAAYQEKIAAFLTDIRNTSWFTAIVPSWATGYIVRRRRGTFRSLRRMPTALR